MQLGVQMASLCFYLPCPTTRIDNTLALNLLLGKLGLYISKI